MDRVFLDANVLFSAAYRSESGLARLWELENIRLFTSAYAYTEAKMNLDTDARLERLKLLMESVEIIENTPDISLPPTITLPEKDRLILQAAIAAGATHLITGDIRHFSVLFGTMVDGVLVTLPAEYMNLKKLNRRKKK